MTNDTGFAVIYLNVSTLEGAEHNITVSMNADTTSWNNTYNDSVNVTTTNATRYKISLTSDVFTAQISAEAEPSTLYWINLTATLKDQYNNTVEDPGIIISFSDNRSETGFGIFNTTSATTDSNGNAMVKMRSQKAGAINVTATNTC